MSHELRINPICLSDFYLTTYNIATRKTWTEHRWKPSPLSALEHELIISARDVNEPPSPPNISIWVYFPFTTPEFLINETINFLCSDDWIDWNHQGSLRQDPSGSQLLKKLFRSRRGTDQGSVVSGPCFLKVGSSVWQIIYACFMCKIYNISFHNIKYTTIVSISIIYLY